MVCSIVLNNELTPRAASIGAVNILRRASAEPGAGWLGDMCDGEGHVNALHQAGCNPAGRRALLVGAGGAGSAIAHALVDAGVAALAVHDPDAARLSALLGKLARYAAATGKAPALLAGSADPAGYGLVVNATPLGMRAGEVLALSLFYKQFVDPIEQIILPSNQGIISFQNARGARAVGAEIEARKDVLVYTTPPLTEDLAVFGFITAELFVASDAPDTDFTVKLVDVEPNGMAWNISDTIQRMRYREGDATPKFMKPGEIYAISPPPMLADASAPGKSLSSCCSTSTRARAAWRFSDQPGATWWIARSRKFMVMISVVAGR